MHVSSVKRKKINLWLLLLIILFILAIIFTIIHITNSSKANSDARYSSISSQSKNKNTTINNIANKETNGSRIGTIESFSSFRDIEDYASHENSNAGEVVNDTSSQNVTPNTQQNAFKIDNHTYTFDNTVTACVKGRSPSQYIELKKDIYLYKISTSSISFSDLRANQNIKDYIENAYKVQTTSDIKTGTVNDNALLICTMAENNEVGYLIITPLNGSEVLSLKVFNNQNKSAMIEDLRDVLNYISILKSSIK